MIMLGSDLRALLAYAPRPWLLMLHGSYGPQQSESSGNRFSIVEPCFVLMNIIP